ncbi:MAG TPA: class I poly(R)-hydroxyalkanoic acid synthase [Bacteroidia bacterium]|jgi:polyhydroxyalkanoate synthase|nr:class I poly(R)-hydroxyalkanoic acid synthase [Bacteroidia bacterium]
MDITEQQKLGELYAAAGKKAMEKSIQDAPGNFSDNIELAMQYSNLFTEIASSPENTAKAQSLYVDFIKKQQDLWQSMLLRQEGKEHTPVIAPADGDKRFKAPEWNEQPYFDFIKQSYLLISELMGNIVDSVDLDERTKKKLGFYTKQYIDAFSPANFLATNPEALKLAKETNGQSITDGVKNFLEDVAAGRITQTDTSAFKLGENLAVTEGSVIYENELIQLIQYKPSTKKVYEIPVLVIPPWINKYYILDLKPENSYVKFIVDQGFTTYLISWKNPTRELGNLGFEDYVEKAALKAAEVIQSVSKAKKVHAVGYCLGGTLLSIALAIATVRKNVPFETATFLACMIDFSDIGPMGDIVDETLIKKIENGELKEQNLMRGKVMGSAFNMIRSNDLIWNYVANSYLKGKKPAPFDILYWNGDNTNLPANMYGYYLRHMLFENKLSRKNALRICDTPIDIGKITIPTFVVGTQEDHISPAHTTFTTTELVSGPTEYVLGGSGHVMGIVNPPAKKKYGYYKDGEMGKGFEEWKKTAKQFEGSWWTPWTAWLKKASGKEITPPAKAGNDKYKVIEPAPGRYVKESC